MASNKEIKARVLLIVSLFKRYQPGLNIVEQVALLTTWIEACSEKEEYEMAGALTNLLGDIQNFPGSQPQRLVGSLDPKTLLIDNPLFPNEPKPLIEVEEKTEKQSIYRKIINKIKKFFNGRFNSRVQKL